MRPRTKPKTLGGALLARAILAGILMAGQSLAGDPTGHAAITTQKMLSHMTKELGLSDSQAQQVKQVLDSHQDQMAAQFTALNSARQALRQASRANPVDEGIIRSAAQALAQAEGDNAILHAQIRSQILPFLTDEQKQKLATLDQAPPQHWHPHPTD